MKKMRGFLITVLAIIIAIVAEKVPVSANDGYKGKLTVKYKLINDDTGVSITVKANGARYVELYISGLPDAYKGYLYEDSRQLEYYYPEEKLTKKKVFSLKGLPAGTYEFWVTVGNEYCEKKTSKKKTIKIKAPEKTAASQKRPDQPDFTSVNPGDTVYLGMYEQDGDMRNGTEPIEWMVLAKNDSKVLLISKYILEYLPYNIEWNEEMVWADSSIREWLNKNFYNNAFSKEEKNMIKKTKVKNPDNWMGTDGGPDTKDRIFLLSKSEAQNEKYFPDDESRIAFPTEYVKSFYGNQYEEGWYWYLRGQGGYAYEGDVVSPYGWIGSIGECFITGLDGIRPCMYVDIK